MRAPAEASFDCARDAADTSIHHLSGREIAMANSSFKTLATHRPKAQLLVQQPDTQRPVTVHSAAIDVMTDFTRLYSVTIAPDASLFTANETMIARGVRLLLVVAENQHLLGIVSTRDTLGERPMQLAHQGKGNLFDLTVADLMHSVGETDMLDFSDVRHAHVGDIVATLKRLGRQHVLVTAVDPVDGRQHVRGVFSATQIGRQLGIEIQTFEVARTFAEIEAALTG